MLPIKGSPDERRDNDKTRTMMNLQRRRQAGVLILGLAALAGLRSYFARDGNDAAADLPSSEGRRQLRGRKFHLRMREKAERELAYFKNYRQAQGLPPLYGKAHTLDLASAARVEPPPPAAEPGRALADAGDESLRVAHCLVGQRGTMDHPMIYQNYNAHVLARIGRPSDVFFVLDGPTPATAPFNPVATAYLEIQDSYYQYGRWIQCLKMIQDYESSASARYSHVIVNRVDQMVIMGLPSIETFPVNSIWAKPHGEFMGQYLPGYTVQDEGAEVGTTTFQPDLGIPDTFQVVPRRLFREYVTAIRDIYFQEAQPRDKQCAPDGATEAVTTAQLCAFPGMAEQPECVLKCALAKANIPVVRQNFQLRVLRSHSKGWCGWFGKHFSHHYDSMCI